MGEQIREARLRVGIGVPELARLAKISTSYVFAIESGKRGSHIDKLWRISEVLGLSLDEMCRKAYQQ